MLIPKNKIMSLFRGTTHFCFPSFPLDQMSWILYDSGFQKSWKRKKQKLKRAYEGACNESWFQGWQAQDFSFFFQDLPTPRNQRATQWRILMPMVTLKSQKDEAFSFPTSKLPVTGSFADS